MPVEIESRHFGGEVVVLRHPAFEDERGFFLEAFRADHFRDLGLPSTFVQDNHSGSRRGVLRGLHFQFDPPLAKLMRVTLGRAFLVAVDIRKGSPTLGHSYGREVSAGDRLQVFAPPGFARGFCAVSEVAEIQYKGTALYNPPGEGAIRWNDPALHIDWPVAEPILSPKDASAGTLADWLARPESDRFRY